MHSTRSQTSLRRPQQSTSLRETSTQLELVNSNSHPATWPEKLLDLTLGFLISRKTVSCSRSSLSWQRSHAHRHATHKSSIAVLRDHQCPPATPQPHRPTRWTSKQLLEPWKSASPPAFEDPLSSQWLSTSRQCNKTCGCLWLASDVACDFNLLIKPVINSFAFTKGSSPAPGTIFMTADVTRDELREISRVLVLLGEMPHHRHHCEPLGSTVVCTPAKRAHLQLRIRVLSGTSTRNSLALHTAQVHHGQPEAVATRLECRPCSCQRLSRSSSQLQSETWAPVGCTPQLVRVLLRLVPVSPS